MLNNKEQAFVIMAMKFLDFAPREYTEKEKKLKDKIKKSIYDKLEMMRDGDITVIKWNHGEPPKDRWILRIHSVMKTMISVAYDQSKTWNLGGGLFIKEPLLVADLWAECPDLPEVEK